MELKRNLVFLSLVTFVISYKSLDGSKKTWPMLRASYVTELIRNWNVKKAEIPNVMIFNVAKNAEWSHEIVKRVPNENPKVIVSSENCGKLENRGETFVIITADNLNPVKLKIQISLKYFNLFFVTANPLQVLQAMR